MEIRLDWKRNGEAWYDFRRMNLRDIGETHGVYCIFVSEPVAIYVGKGDIADRLLSHRGNQEIREFQETMPEVGELLVTWAKVVPGQCIGVERYLHLPDVLDPILSKGPPYGGTIGVNTPF